MDADKHKQSLEELRGAIRRQRWSITGLTGALLLALIAVLSLIGRERTIVIPPAIDKSFWVSKDRVSTSYLIEMGEFVAGLILNVHAQNIEWKRELLLAYVAPEAAGALKTRQELEAERLRKMNALTVFMPGQYFPSEETASVVIKGQLLTLINGMPVEKGGEGKAYIAGFGYSGGRIQLKTFKEIPYDNAAHNQAVLLADGSARLN